MVGLLGGALGRDSRSTCESCTCSDLQSLDCSMRTDGRLARLQTLSSDSRREGDLERTTGMTCSSTRHISSASPDGPISRSPFEKLKALCSAASPIPVVRDRRDGLLGARFQACQYQSSRYARNEVPTSTDALFCRIERSLRVSNSQRYTGVACAVLTTVVDSFFAPFQSSPTPSAAALRTPAWNNSTT